MTHQVSWYDTPQDRIVLDLIARDNEIESVSLVDFELTRPDAIVPTEDIPRNTRIVLKSKPTGTHYGTRTFYYNRIDINDFLFNGLITEEDLILKVGTETSTAALARQLGELLHIHMTPEMILDVPIPLFTSGQMSMDMVAHDYCYTLRGRVNVTLTR